MPPIEGAPLVNWHDVVAQLVAANDPEAVVDRARDERLRLLPVDARGDRCGDGGGEGRAPRAVDRRARSDGPVPDDPDAVNEAIRDAADRWDNLTVVDFDELVGDEDIAYDRVHLSDDGQVQFAESLAAVLT